MNTTVLVLLPVKAIFRLNKYCWQARPTIPAIFRTSHTLNNQARGWHRLSRDLIRLCQLSSARTGMRQGDTGRIIENNYWEKICYFLQNWKKCFHYTAHFFPKSADNNLVKIAHFWEMRDFFSKFFPSLFQFGDILGLLHFDGMFIIWGSFTYFRYVISFFSQKSLPVCL